MAKWFFQIDGEQFGPVESDVLRRIAASGRLKPEHKVRREDSKDWHLAKQVSGLFATGQKTSPPSPTAKLAQVAPQTVTTGVPQSTKWYYIVDGQEIGPLELADLKRLAAEGRLKPTQQLRQADASQSKTAEQLLPGLFVTSDRTSEKPIPKKPNRVLIYALGCLAVPVGGILLLFIAGLIVGGTYPKSRQRAQSREQSSSFKARIPATHETSDDTIIFIGKGNEDFRSGNHPYYALLFQQSMGDSIDVSRWQGRPVPEYVCTLPAGTGLVVLKIENMASNDYCPANFV